MIAALPVGQARALDDSNPTGLVTETVASRENLRDYDGAKKYGAERIGDRSRKHVTPDGVRAGSFYFFPSVDSQLIYDDNIFRAPAGREEADLRAELRPAIVVKSHLPRHILNFAFDGRLVGFAENSDQDYADARAAVDGALHVDHAHTFAAHAMTRLTHEERNELSASLNAAEPTQIHHTRLIAGLTRDAGRLYGTLSATAERYDLEDVRSIDGGIIDQDGRDRDVISTQLRAGYRFSPGFEAVGKFRLLRQVNGADGFNDLDATGYEALAGLAFETSPLLRWRLLGGYGIRDYDSSDREQGRTTLLEGQVEWLPTQRMTIYGSVGRDFNDFAGENFTGWIETSVKARVEYEIHNNLVLKLGANFAHADFQGIDRQDNVYTGTVGLEYYMNKNWLFTFSYEHEHRDSDDDVFDMDRNRFMIGAKLRF